MKVIKRGLINPEDFIKAIASAVIAASFIFPVVGCKAKEEFKKPIVESTRIESTIAESNQQEDSSFVDIKDLGMVSLLTSNDGSYVYGPVKKVYDQVKGEEYYIIYGNDIKAVQKDEHGTYSTYSYGPHGFKPDEFIIVSSVSKEDFNSPAILNHIAYEALDKNTTIDFKLENNVVSIEKFKGTDDDSHEYTWQPVGYIEKDGITTVYFAFINTSEIEGVELGSLSTRGNPYCSYSFDSKFTTIEQPTYQTEEEQSISPQLQAAIQGQNNMQTESNYWTLKNSGKEIPDWLQDNYDDLVARQEAEENIKTR